MYMGGKPSFGSVDLLTFFKSSFGLTDVSLFYTHTFYTFIFEEMV